MIAALALLGGGLVTCWSVPVLLRRLDQRGCDPVAVALGWLSSMVGVVATGVAAVVVLFLPDHGPAGLLVAMREGWSHVHHGASPHTELHTGLLGVVLLVAIGVRVTVVSVRGFRGRVRAHRERLAVLRLAARSDRDPRVPGGILWLEHDRPMAFSMPGRPAIVVATEGLRRHLPPSAVEAVLAHERAHLSGRHRPLITAADALRAAAPPVPLFRRAPDEIRRLVELAADRTAVRHCGAAAVRTALLAVSRHGVPSTALAMGQGAIEPRLARLGRDRRPRGRAATLASRVTVSLAALAVPGLVGNGMLVAVAAVGGFVPY